MSLLKPVAPAELGTKYSHYGWFVGLVPIYLGNINSEAPIVVERNWVPECWFTAAEALFGLFCWVSSMLSQDFEPAFPIVITGKIKT